MTSSSLRPRSLTVLWDGPALASDLARLVAELAPEDILLVSSASDVGAERGWQRVRGPRELGRLLGRGFDAVALDLRESVDADALGRAEGLVRGGGALVLLVSPAVPGALALAVHPFSRSDVGTRFAARLFGALSAPDARDVVRDPSVPLAPADRVEVGTAEQATLVEELAEVLCAEAPVMVSVLADRGRGKSAALGLGIARALERGPLRVAVCAASLDGLSEVLRFAPKDRVSVMDSAALLAAEPGSLDAIVIDEAAQLAVPRLVHVAERHRTAKLVLSTTCRGYEGTGRGYVLRFLEWARTSGRPLLERTLETPIRFPAQDPLERFVHRLLLLDAEPTRLPRGAPSEVAERTHERVPPDRLAADEPLLTEAFGLLVHAHYRTSPGDLARLLDAPNLELHVLREDRRVVSTSLVALEGGLSLEHAERLARGQERIRGHALCDTLVTHCQRPDAGVLRMVRSVRIATHPGRRRQGLARALVSAIHDAHAVDVFGTVFGATASLLRFRHELGYELLRLGASRGARSGEPSVVMVRPVSQRARALVRDLRLELARELPLQLELLRTGGELELSTELAEALAHDLPSPPPLTPVEIEARVRRYVASAQPSSSAPYALVAFAEQHRGALAELGPGERALIEARVLERLDWATAARRAGLPSAGAATRALRAAIAALLSLVAPAAS